MITIPIHRIFRVCFITLLAASPVQATLSEPDNLLYGTITLDSLPVTSTRSDVAVEARRTAEGPPIARYEMGSDSTLGDFYSLRVTLQSADDPTAADASTTGAELFIVVTDASGDRAQARYTVGERGEVMRLDFGSGSGSDSDGNQLADAWEIAMFGEIGQNPQAINRNGHTTLDNYVAGINPNDAFDRFAVDAAFEGGQRKVSFLAREAIGTGYEGMRRFYTLQASSDVGGGWSVVPGFVDVEGRGQTVIYMTPLDGPKVFYRGIVRLEQE